MRLDAQTPAWVTQAVIDSELGIPGSFGSVHRLQEEVLEIESLEILRRRVLLRVNELELAAGRLDERCARFGADADPIERCGCRSGAVGLDRDFEPALVQLGDQILVECVGMESA